MGCSQRMSKQAVQSILKVMSLNDMERNAHGFFSIAKTFSTRYANHLLEQVRKIKPAAAEYIENINDTFWQSIDWLDIEGRSFRRGMVLSH